MRGSITSAASNPCARRLHSGEGLRQRAGQPQCRRAEHELVANQRSRWSIGRNIGREEQRGSQDRAGHRRFMLQFRPSCRTGCRSTSMTTSAGRALRHAAWCSVADGVASRTAARYASYTGEMGDVPSPCERILARRGGHPASPRCVAQQVAVTSAHRTGFVPSQMNPVSPCRMFSRGPPARLPCPPSTGKPAACASRTTSPCRVGPAWKNNRVGPRKHVVTDSRPSVPVKIASGIRSASHGRNGPSPRDHEIMRQADAGKSRSTSAGSTSSPSTRQPADEQHGGVG